MACNRFSSLPAASASLTGAEILPLTQLGVDRRTVAAAIAVSATTWNNAIAYPIGAYVRASNGNIYQAVAISTNEDPATTSAAFWLPVLVTADFIVNVPSEIATIPAAFTYLSRAAIADGFTVTIQVDDGAYALTTTQLDLNHAYGSQIELIGNTGAPGSCTITFTALPAPPSTELLDDSGSIFVNDGNSFGLIDGFTITKAGGAPVFGHCAILAYNGTVNVGPNMVISGFWAQLASAKEGSLLAVGSGSASVTLATSSANTFALYSDGGFLDASFATVTTVATSSVAGLRRGGQMVLRSMDATGTNAATSTIFTVSQGGKVDEVSATYGSFTAYASVNGLFEFNDYVTVDEFGTYATRSLLLTIFQAQTVRAGTSVEVGSTTAFTGIQAGQSGLDGAGVVVVPATWVTLNSIPVVCGNDASTGHIYADIADIVDGVSFTVRSDGGAADSGVAVNWIVMVYP